MTFTWLTVIVCRINRFKYEFQQLVFAVAQIKAIKIDSVILKKKMLIQKFPQITCVAFEFKQILNEILKMLLESHMSLKFEYRALRDAATLTLYTLLEACISLRCG